MNARSYPFLRLLAPALAGLVLGSQLAFSPSWLPAALLAGALLLFPLAFVSFPYRRRWIFGALWSLWLLGAAWLHIAGYDERVQPDHFARCGALPDTLALLGEVYDAPGHGARLKVPVRVLALARDSGWAPCSGHLLLLADTTGPVFQYGDRLLVRGVVQEVPPPQNPDAFDYQRYLHFQNIHYQSFVRDSQVQVYARGHGYALWRAAFQWRDALLAMLRLYFPETDEYAVACALLVGYKDDLSDDLKIAYAETGSMHALAVSGTHVGMLYAGLLFFFQRLPFRGRAGKMLEALLILGLIWGFTFLTGASASVLRASVMFSAFLIGKAVHREASAWNILTASAFGLLAWNPYYLYDAGFQLSYAAVAGMVFFYPRFYRNSPLMSPWMDAAWKAFLVGVSAQIGTLPLGFFYFHQFPVYFWLSGWVVVLGGAIFLWAGAALIVLHLWWGVAAYWLGMALFGMLWGMNRIIFGIQALPGSLVSGIWIGWVEALLWYVAIVWLGGLMVTRRGRWALGLCGTMALLSLWHAGRRWNQECQQAWVVYQAPGYRLYDFFCGRHLYTFQAGVPERQIRFAAQNHRWARGVRETTFLLPDSTFKSNYLAYRPPIIQFYGEKILLTDTVFKLGTFPAPFPVDAVVIAQNTKVKPDSLLHYFPFRRLYVDGSNKRWRAEKWRAWAREHHFDQ
jgi:competence protein ComEC